MIVPRMGLFRSRPRTGSAPLGTMFHASAPDMIYAVGDVHGCLRLLRRLEEMILTDAAARSTDTWIVMLGDYVDRGPQSAGVLDYLMADLRRPGFRRWSIAGNHEAAMLAFLADPARNAQWLDLGGVDTLASYGIPPSLSRSVSPGSRRMRQLLDSHIPQEHVQFLTDLPALIETPDYVFVHAGVRAGITLAQQTLDDLLWARHPIAELYREFGKIVVHGHIPLATPLIGPNRIAIDTAAYLTGRLTAVRLCSGEAPVLLVAQDDTSIGP